MSKLQTKRKLLIICGPTATGKTKLGIFLAQKFNGEIISADSRQVYKFMDVGTGKEWGDITTGEASVHIHGYDLVDPKDNFSVFEYLKFVRKTLEDIWNRGKLPILVGGTGLYIKAVVEGIDTLNIPKNLSLRKSLEEKSVSELYEKLATLDSSKAASMNISDKNNPRRLIRAIEIAIWKMSNEQKVSKPKKGLSLLNTLYIGLNYPTDQISSLITSRVEKRIEMGFIDEVEDLLKMGVSWKMQSMNALGYKEAEGFFKNGLTYEEFVEKWIESEINYVKRQLTWFKKEKQINWFDLTKQGELLKLEKLVERWDNSNNDTKS